MRRGSSGMSWMLFLSSSFFLLDFLFKCFKFQTLSASRLLESDHFVGGVGWYSLW